MKLQKRLVCQSATKPMTRALPLVLQTIADRREQKRVEAERSAKVAARAEKDANIDASVAEFGKVLEVVRDSATKQAA